MALWTPAEISTSLWLDASDGATITESGGKVSQWNDKSGNSRHATQGTLANRPTTGLVTVNGLNAIDFDGADDWLVTSGYIPANTSAGDLCAFIVANSTGSADRALLSTRGLTNNGFTFRTNSTTQTAYFHAGATPTLTLAISAGANVFQFVRDALSVRLGENGSLGSATSLSNYTVSGQNLTIGADSGAGFSRFDGPVCEVVLLESLPTDAIREQIEGYLSWKWGLESRLPALHPYKSAAPTIGGVGGTATASPSPIGVSAGTGSASGQRNVTATATPVSLSVSPGLGEAVARIIAIATASPASISASPGDGRGVTGAALGYPTYRVVRDSYRDPIFSRGKVILSRPLEPGQRLAIERKTPITQLVPFTRDEPFSAEGFEYAMDKITFIQQEIEGHACDCRPKDAEDDAEDKYYEEFPVCRPYSCDAYISALEKSELPFTKLYRPTLIESFSWPFALLNDDGSLEYYNFFSAAPAIQSAWGSKVNKVDATEWFDASAYPDNCDGRAKNVVSFLGPDTGDVALLLPNGGGLGGDWAITAIVSPLNGGSVMSRSIARCSNKNWSFNVGASSFTASADKCGVTINSPTQITLAINTGESDTYTIPTLLNKWSLISVLVESTTPTVVPNGSGFNLKTTVTVKARVNGLSFEKSGDVLFAEGVPSVGSVTQINNTLYTQTRMLYSSANTEGISASHLAAGVVSKSIDLETLELGFLRNFTGYTPPDFCIFPKD